MCVPLLGVAGLVERLVPRRCVICGAPAPGLCEGCSCRLYPPPRVEVAGYTNVSAVAAYDGAGKDLIAAIKFRGRFDAVDMLASAMAVLVDEPVDLITWVPTSAARRRQRGVDQSQMLARAVGRRLCRPVVPTLRRRAAGELHRLGRHERAAATHLGAARRLGAVAGRRVLVVDDVVTTGASLRLAGVLLGSAQPSALSAVVVAATP